MALRRYLQHNLIAGLRAPLRTSPSGWLIAAGYGCFALVVGLGSELLVFGWPSWVQVLIIPALLVVYPSLLEESIFRGLLLPRSLRHASQGRQFAAVTVSTALFVAMHPLNAWLIDLSDTSQFTEPAFLAIVMALGYACGYLYLRSGSLRAPIALHWLTVVSWNLFLGRELSL